MKKFMLFIALLCAGKMISAQEVMKLENVAAPTEKDDWIGNTNVTNMAMMADAIMVMAPRQINPEISGTITKLKFYRTEYNEYNTTSFTLKIYEGIDLQVYDEYMNYYYFESCGEEVYSQDFTATENGWHTVELDVPYEIGDGEFWIGVEMHGDGMAVFGGQSTAVRGQYYYSDQYEFVWYWKPCYFVVDWDEALFSFGMAVYVEEGSDVDENVVDAADDVCVYPNPAEGFVNVKADGLQNVELIDMTGRVISRNESSETMMTVDLSSLTSGIYFLRVTTEKGVATKRVEVK